MTKASKFDEADREAVIRVIQDRYCVRLTPVGRRPKWLRDDNGKNYWVLGASAGWHGVPEEMMDAETKTPTAGKLVIANRSREAIQVFDGPLEPLVRNRNKLSRNKIGDYQFTVKQSEKTPPHQSNPGVCLDVTRGVRVHGRRQVQGSGQSQSKRFSAEAVGGTDRGASSRPRRKRVAFTPAACPPAGLRAHRRLVAASTGARARRSVTSSPPTCDRAVPESPSG
jgi:hypothetical protein